MGLTKAGKFACEILAVSAVAFLGSYCAAHFCDQKPSPWGAELFSEEVGGLSAAGALYSACDDLGGTAFVRDVDNHWKMRVECRKGGHPGALPPPVRSRHYSHNPSMRIP